jgi:hypothetical protein
MHKVTLCISLAPIPSAAQGSPQKTLTLYRQKVADLRTALTDPATRIEALEILRSLVETVTVKALAKGFEIELVGEIAHMVAMAAGSRNGKAASLEAAGGVFAG